MPYVYILISLMMLITAITMLVQIFRKVKEPFMQMFLGGSSVGQKKSAIGVFVAGLH